MLKLWTETQQFLSSFLLWFSLNVGQFRLKFSLISWENSWEFQTKILVRFGRDWIQLSDEHSGELQTTKTLLDFCRKFSRVPFRISSELRTNFVEDSLEFQNKFLLKFWLESWTSLLLYSHSREIKGDSTELFILNGINSFYVGTWEWSGLQVDIPVHSKFKS